ncbi:MAG: site-2 protease family protein [Hyphomonadaceae bacterium]
MNGGGLRIGAFAGAPVILDWSVAILAGFVIFSGLDRGGLAALPDAISFLIAIVISILAHEFAHAGVAAALSLPSKRIVLTFFGGHVEFVRPPEKRWHDILVSAAGPFANLAIAAIIGFLVAPFLSRDADPAAVQFLYQLLFLNLILGAFNLLPGFPLDGGRILSSALRYFLAAARARMIAAAAGVLVALGLIAYGYFNGLWWTAAIAVILLLAAIAEFQAARGALKGDEPDQSEPGRSNT